MPDPRAEQLRDTIVPAVLDAANPAHAVANARVPFPFTPAALIATGKAAAPMTEAALERFGSTITHGVITCVPEHEHRIRTACAKHPGIEIYPADHPLPTDRNRIAADAVARFAEQCSGENADTLVLISGGASAHLTSPATSPDPALTLDDLRAATDALLRAGATIHQLNTLRKHCETLKGGRLAQKLAPARAHVLVLSDVLGDPLETIGSGPTAPDPTTYADALAVLDAFPDAPIPDRVRAHLQTASDTNAPETPKPHDPCFNTITHEIIANNANAMIAAQRSLECAGIRVAAVLGRVQGEAADIARRLVAELAECARPAAIVYAGETTVTVGEATGKGGRNQELALAAAIALDQHGIENAAVLTLATDGADGPTDAAGALVTSTTTQQLRDAGTDPHQALANHDSHTALDSIHALIRTGPTGTNINDIAAAILF